MGRTGNWGKIRSLTRMHGSLQTSWEWGSPSLPLRLRWRFKPRKVNFRRGKERQWKEWKKGRRREKRELKKTFLHLLWAECTCFLINPHHSSTKRGLLLLPGHADTKGKHSGQEIFPPSPGKDSNSHLPGCRAWMLYGKEEGEMEGREDRCWGQDVQKDKLLGAGHGGSWGHRARNEKNREWSVCSPRV